MLSETRYINETYSIIYNYGKTYTGKYLLYSQI